MVKSGSRLRQTVTFLRMAASEIRRLAERAPDIAVELRRAAQQLDAEADELDEAEKR
jgi:hypothetical protein